MFIGMALIVSWAVLSVSAGIAGWKHHQAQYQQVIEAERQAVRSAHHYRQTRGLTAVRRHIERPLFGQPDRSVEVNVTSLNQQAGVTAGVFEAHHFEAPSLDLRDHPPLTSAPEDRTPPAPAPWPDRHPTLYGHLPWAVRRLIIAHYLKETE